jgi:hypothetical protein
MTSLKAAALELPLRPCPVRNKREERMDLKDLEPNAPIPDELTPPSRPGWKVFVGAAVVVLGVAVLMNGHALAQLLGL